MDTDTDSVLHFYFVVRMSAIDFFCSVDKVKGVDGKERVVLTFDGKYLPHTEHVSHILSVIKQATVYLIYLSVWANSWVAGRIIIILRLKYSCY